MAPSAEGFGCWGCAGWSRPAGVAQASPLFSEIQLKKSQSITESDRSGPNAGAQLQGAARSMGATPSSTAAAVAGCDSRRGHTEVEDEVMHGPSRPTT